VASLRALYKRGRTLYDHHRLASENPGLRLDERRSAAGPGCRPAPRS
jgi:hypothetical protein